MRIILSACTNSQNILHVLNRIVRTKKNDISGLKAVFYHCSEVSQEETLPLEWYDQAFPRLTELNHSLKNLDFIDGKLVDVSNNSTITDEQLHLRMWKFKTLARDFLGLPSIIKGVNEKIQVAMEGTKCPPTVCFSNTSERQPLSVSSLTPICNFLNISAQQRKVVRFTICPQVTQHQIWTSGLEEILNSLLTEMGESGSVQNKGIHIARQIVHSCLNFLAETVKCCNEDASSSWMRPKPKRAGDSPSTRKWGEVLEMFKDLIECLKDKEELKFHVSKLEAMKEGLAQIKDVTVDRNIGYKEVKHQESLVQKKLLKTLGHSSRCLFTLLQYYLYGTIRDLDVEVCGGACKLGRKDELCLYMGKITTSDEEEIIRRGVKQLDRALELFKFVWETAHMKEKLELHGHLFCIGAEHRTLRYRGNLYFVHGISL